MPWQRQVLDTALEIENGMFAYKEVIVTVPRQSGKTTSLLSLILARAMSIPNQRIVYALALDTPLPTPTGWTTMGDVRPGDELLGSDGRPTRVVDTSEITLGSPCYRVTFSDGAEIICSGDHLWEVWSYGKSSPSVKTTDEIRSTAKCRNGRQNRHRVRVADPLDLPDRDVAVDPYILGYWLGDGTSRAAQIAVCGTDLEAFVEQARTAGYSTRVADGKGNVYRVQLTIGGSGCRGRYVDSVRSRLSKIGVLGKKHIPSDYLRSSKSQRVSLLQGLMDSDGCVSRHTCQLALTNRQLAEDALELVRSLGIKPAWRVKDRWTGKEDHHKIQYVITFAASDLVDPFRLPRKAAEHEKIRALRRETRSNFRSIVSVDPVPSRAVRCVEIDAPDHLYLAGREMIPTHNTAQTRADARKKWFEEWIPTLQGSPFNEHFKTRLANGDEALIFDNGSRQGLVASTAKAGHGQTLDLGIVDEAFSQADARLEQSLKPAMITRNQPPHKGAQLWIVSTAGTLTSSPYLLSKVEAGREISSSGLNKSVAYFEWSADEDADPADEETWWSCMPALGRTAPVDAVRADFLSMDIHEFQRAYLNQWTTISLDPVIPIQEWLGEPLVDKTMDTTGIPVVLAVDVTPDRGHASVAASGCLPDGNQFVEVIAHRPKTNWVPGFIEQVCKENRVTCVVIDQLAPAGSLIHDISDRVHVDIKTLTAQELSKACGMLYDAATDTKALRHTAQPNVTAALDGAAKRPIGDGGWAWGRKSSGTDISPLVALTLAHWGSVMSGPTTVGVWSLDEIVRELREKRGQETQPTQASPGVTFTPLIGGRC